MKLNVKKWVKIKTQLDHIDKKENIEEKVLSNKVKKVYNDNLSVF